METDHITRLEYEARNTQTREQFQNLHADIDLLRQELSQVKDSINAMKFNGLKFIVTTGVSFFAGGGGFTILLKALGKL